MIYGEKLKELREKNNLTQENISKLLGLKDDAYGQYEREYIIIPLKHLITLCNYYNVSLDYIFNLNDITQYEKIQPTIDKNKSGKYLKNFRKEKKCTQKKLANILNISENTIGGYESGRYLIATPFLYTISKKYNISSDYLLGRIDEPKYLK